MGWMDWESCIRLRRRFVLRTNCLFFGLGMASCSCWLCFGVGTGCLFLGRVGMDDGDKRVQQNLYSSGEMTECSGGSARGKLFFLFLLRYLETSQHLLVRARQSLGKRKSRSLGGVWIGSISLGFSLKRSMFCLPDGNKRLLDEKKIYQVNFLPDGWIFAVWDSM